MTITLAYSAGTNAETRECVRRAPKGGRVCLQWAVAASTTAVPAVTTPNSIPVPTTVAPSPPTTTPNSPTTSVAPTTTVPSSVGPCDLGSVERQQAWSDTIHYYIYADNRDVVAFDAYVFTVVCPGPLGDAAQAVIDCFNGGTGPACIQTPENPAGVFEGIVYFAQALVPNPPD